MIDNKNQLLNFLMELVSGFSLWWSSEENYNISDSGDFSMAGICAEFSQFYIDNFDKISDSERSSLFFL